MSDGFLVYGIQCAGGDVDAHGRPDYRSNPRKVGELAELYNGRHSACSPHTVVAARITRSKWVPASAVPTVREPARTEPLNYHCPTCDAAPGKPCINQAKLRVDGREQPTLWPHGLRLVLWEAALRAETEAKIQYGVADLELTAYCPVCPPGIVVAFDDNNGWWGCRTCGCSWGADGTGGQHKGLAGDG